MRNKSAPSIVLLGLLVLTVIVADVPLVLAQNSSTQTTVKIGSKRTKPRWRKSQQSGRCDPMQQEQVDLSGTYIGKLKLGSEPAADASLTITGNNFTATAGSDTSSGRIVAVTTCGYMAVTMMMGDLTPPPPGPNPPAALPAISLRGKKVGNHLTLTSVAGEKGSFFFASAGGNDVPISDVVDSDVASGRRPKSHIEVFTVSFKDDIELKQWLTERASEHKRLRMIIPSTDHNALFVLETVRRNIRFTYSVLAIPEAMKVDRLNARISQNPGETFVGVYPMNQNLYLTVFYGKR